MSSTDISIGMYIRYFLSVSIVGVCLSVSVALCALEMLHRHRIMRETKVSFSKILPNRLNLISGLILSSCLVSLCCQFLVQFGAICSFFSFFPHHIFLIGFAKMSFCWFQLERLSLIFGRNHSSLQKYSYSSVLFNLLRFILMLLLISHSYNVMFQCGEPSHPTLPAFVGCVSVQITPLTVINYGTLIVTEWIVLSLYVYKIHQLSNDVQKHNVISLYALVQKIFVLSIIMEMSFLTVVVFSLFPAQLTYPWREVADAIDQLITIRFVLLIMDHNLHAYNAFAKFWNGFIEHVCCCKRGQHCNYCVLHIITKQHIVEHTQDTNTTALHQKIQMPAPRKVAHSEAEEEEKKSKKSQLTPIAKMIQFAGSPTITCNFESTVDTIPSREDDDEEEEDGAEGHAESEHLKQVNQLQQIKQTTPSPDIAMAV